MPHRAHIVAKVKQFRVSVMQRGLLPTLYWAAAGYLRWNRFQLFAQPTGRETVVASSNDVRYEIWGAARLRAWRLGRGPLRPEFFQDQIDGVGTCAVALVGDSVAGLIWIYRSGDVSRLFRLGPHDAELNMGAVLEAYRRHGLFTNILRYAVGWLGTQNCRMVYAGVHIRNAASRIAFQRAGFSRIGTILHVGIIRPGRDVRNGLPTSAAELELHSLVGRSLLDPLGASIGRIRRVELTASADSLRVNECIVDCGTRISGDLLDLSDLDAPRIKFPGDLTSRAA
jgi:ribosomal protein S18 acetylase RimI-like enzyme